MNENSVVSLRQKDEIDDPLTEILRAGARKLIVQAVEIEFDTFLALNARLVLPDGRQRVVRHGHDPVRTIQTGIGPVEVQKPKARDRAAPAAGERIRFTSAILPKWARRTKSLDALLPVLYLRGISAGDFQEVLTALLGKDAPNLSPAVIARLKGEWEDEYQRWQKLDLSARRYVYVWADGVYLQARMFVNAVKGLSSLQLSRNLGLHAKTAFVLLHKLRCALTSDSTATILSGVVEIDGGWFGGYIRPENYRVARIDRRRREHQNGKRLCWCGRPPTASFVPE